jgi:ribose transport system substrate-binding protein
MKKHLVLTRTWSRLTTIAASLAMAAAIAVPGASAQNAGETKVPVAFFVSGLTSFTQPSVDELKKAYANRVALSVFNDNFNPQTQVSQCQDAITAQRFKAFIVEPTDGGPLVPCTQAAIKSGIKVVSVDDPPIGPDPLSEKIQVPGQVGMDLISIGVDVKAAVDMTLQACGNLDPCNIAMLVAVPTFGYTAYKRQHELDEFKAHPNIHVVAENVTGFDSPDKAEAAIRTDLLKSPNINVILGDDDSTLSGAERAVAAVGKTPEIKLIGDGANKYGVAAVAAGRWFGTVADLPRTGARTAERMALDAVDGKPIAHVVVIQQLQERVCPRAEVVRACAAKFKAEW